MNRVDLPTEVSPLLSEEKLVVFIETFYRIFKVGIYYPTGHAVLDQSADKCIHQLREISPTLERVTILISRNGLLVENIPLPESSTSARELYLLLERLGVRSIELQITVTQKQVLFLVRKLLAWRMQLESTQTFITFDVADLPQGIRLVQQEFLIDERAIAEENREKNFTHQLDDICFALGDQGLNRQQVAQCRAFLVKLSDAPPSEKRDKLKGFANATWQDVQTLLYKIVTGSHVQDKQQSDAIANSDINVIGSIFKNLEANLTDKKSKETIQFLLSHLTSRATNSGAEESPPESQPRKMRQILEDENKLTITELKSFVYQNQIPLKILEQITSVDSSEELSILFQLLSPENSVQLRSNLELKLRTILGSNLGERAKEVLQSGMADLAVTGDLQYFRSLLSFLLQALRDSELYNSVDFLIGFWGRVSPVTQMSLWPFLVNELLLVGKRGTGESFVQATEFASQLHVDRMRKLLFQLEDMAAFQEKKVARTVFEPSLVSSYKLFAFLLETSLEGTLAELLHTRLCDKPPDALFEAIGPLLDISRPAQFEFFRSYLIQAHIKEPTLALKMAAGQIILQFLQNISEEQRELPWLPKTISAMAGLYVKGMKDMLGRIIKEKKMGLLPKWPRNCRIAAEATLKSLKRPSLSELL